MTEYPICTIALSAHNAIAARGPMRAADIASFLRSQWDESVDDDEVADACAELVGRGYARVDGDGIVDTMIRNAKGQRCPAPARQRDPNSPNYGWW